MSFAKKQKKLGTVSFTNKYTKHMHVAEIQLDTSLCDVETLKNFDSVFTWIAYFESIHNNSGKFIPPKRYSPEIFKIDDIL